LFILLKTKKTIVPLNIELNSDDRFLLISGPNAGGKSVCLKTLGLLQFMFQCGLLIPANSRSTFGIFRSIFLDIGDQQSIENDLSTYSSHLKNMAAFIANADYDSLVLIDEMGAGTDPNFGGGIAEAILAELIDRKVWGVVTAADHFWSG
jgi:DNA mismatch repair protein MutS2